MKKAITFIFLFFLVAFVTAKAFAWGSATHAYFAKELGKKRGYLNFQEIYGGMLPDLFNPLYGSDYRDYFWQQTHHEFMKVVDNAWGCKLKACAFAVGSHNDAWGADYTAHHDGRTTPGSGYVSTKVESLAPQFVPPIKALLIANGFDPAEAEVLAGPFAHQFADISIETAVDVLIKRNEDPGVGWRMFLSARLRSWRVPRLLVSAYAYYFAQAYGLSMEEATQIIVQAEKEFRDLMKLYGLIFIRDETEMIQLLAAQGAESAEMIIKNETGRDVTIPPEVLVNFLNIALFYVEPDYAVEVSATLSYLEEELANRGIETCSFPFLWRAQADKPETQITAKPLEFSLSQNHPNPFNPATTIDYYLPKESHVKIAVYNALGQKVDVLVDASQPRGHHSITWDASGLASGIYFYRIETESYTASRRMHLLK
jgi:hypothetical protein